MKKILLIGMIVGAISSAIYFFVQKKAAGNEQNFIVGTAAGYAPFVSVDGSGNYEGFDIDVARAVAESMGKRLVLKDLGSMTSLFMALDQGMIDAIIWGISITKDRLEKVAMIHYQGATTQSYPLIFWQPILKDIKKFEDLEPLVVCVEPGSAQDAVIARYPKIRTIAVEKIDDALLQIQYGKADAAFVEPAIAQKFCNKYPQITTVDMTLPEKDIVQGIGIVIKKNNAPLIEQVTVAVADLKKSGVIDQAAQRWDIPS